MSPSKNPEADTSTISDISDSLHPLSLKTDPICPMYPSTHFGISDRGRSINLSGDENKDDEEFLFRLSMEASLQNSTHLGVLPPITTLVSKLLLEKLVEAAADFSLRDLCF